MESILRSPGRKGRKDALLERALLVAQLAHLLEQDLDLDRECLAEVVDVPARESDHQELTLRWKGEESALGGTRVTSACGC
jgi:hypothetical protein